MGSVCCSDNTYCPSGTVCAKAGENRCIPRTSPSLCSNGTSYCPVGHLCTRDNTCLSMTSDRYCGGRSYCPAGYECAGGGKCRPVGSSTSTPGSGNPDSGSGVGDARYCIDVERSTGTVYTVKNTCTFGVSIKLRTMDFSPKTTTDDSYYIGAGGDIVAISYHDYTPEVVSACGRGSVC